MNKKVILGIDFGTTNSCISYYDETGAHVIPNKNGNLTSPTCLFFYDNHGSEGVLIGDSAYALLNANNNGLYLSNIITNVKRLVGLTYDMYSGNTEIKRFFENRNNEIIAGDDSDQVYFKCNGEVFSVSYTIGLYIRWLLNLLIDYNLDCTQIILTVPAYYTHLQREYLKKICERSGLEVLRIINEPTAAALAYATIESNTEDETVMVIDCGGGTTDITVIEMDYTNSIYEVQCVRGDNYLGGEDITENLVVYFQQKIGLSKLTSKQYNRLKRECEELKKQLSFNLQATLFLESFNDDGDVDYLFTLTRTQFVIINDMFFKKIENFMYELKQIYDIDKIVFVGGSTRIPHFRQLCEDIFGKDIPIHSDIHPDHAISIGTAYLGYQMSQTQTQNTATTTTTTQTTANTQTTASDTLLVDVINLDLGVELLGGLMSVIIPRNTKLPVQKKRRFTNSEDNVSNLEIKVYQGNRKLVEYNQLLGIVELQIDSSFKRREMTIDITFRMDTDGILTIHVQSGNYASSITFTHANSSLQEEQQDEDLDVIIQDTYLCNQIIAKLELYDVVKMVVAGATNSQRSCRLEDLERLNVLYDETMNIIRNYQDYTPDRLKHIAKTFSERWMKILTKT